MGEPAKTKEYGIDTQILDQLTYNTNSLLRLLEAKSEDYGKAIELCGLKGLSYRLLEKMCRLMNIVENGNTSVDEDVGETLRDMAGIALLGRSYHDLGRLFPEGTWKSVMAWPRETGPLVGWAPTANNIDGIQLFTLEELKALI